MKRILLSLAILALTATAAPAAKQPVVDFGLQQPAQGVRVNKQQMPLRGNVSSKIYHASDCEYYGSKAATAEFANAREAEKAGYHACKVCEGREGVATTKKQQRQEQGQARVVLHGNPSSKVVHGPSCKYYASKSATENFTSLEHAKKQGYKVCTMCEGK